MINKLESIKLFLLKRKIFQEKNILGYNKFANAFAMTESVLHKICFHKKSKVSSACIRKFSDPNLILEKIPYYKSYL